MGEKPEGMSWGEWALLKLTGAAGKTIDTVGTFLGDPFGEGGGYSERLESAGSAVFDTAGRIEESLDQRGAIAEGDYTTGVGLGYSPLELASRADGGILTPEQGTINSQTSSRYNELKTLADKGDLNPVQKTEWDAINEPTGGDSSSSNTLQQILDWQRQMAGGAWDKAQGIFSEGMGLINQRRGEFADQFASGKDSILDTFEQKRGELQAVGQGASERLRNSLRALGLGGSAFIKGQGRQTQNEARAFGGLQTERGVNETANQNLLNEKNTWARGQESSLGRFLQTAQGQYDLAGKQQGVLDSVLANIASAQGNLSGVNTGTAGYNSPDFGSNYSDIATALNSTLPSFGTTSPGQTANVNLGNENMSELEKMRLRAGGRLYT